MPCHLSSVHMSGRLGVPGKARRRLNSERVSKEAQRSQGRPSGATYVPNFGDKALARPIHESGSADHEGTTVRPQTHATLAVVGYRGELSFCLRVNRTALPLPAGRIFLDRFLDEIRHTIDAGR